MSCNGVFHQLLIPTEEGWGCKGGEVRLVAWSIHVTLSDKGAQSTQINPSRSDGSGVPYFAIEVLLKLACGVGHTGQFGV